MHDLILVVGVHYLGNTIHQPESYVVYLAYIDWLDMVMNVYPLDRGSAYDSLFAILCHLEVLVILNQDQVLVL